MGNKKRKNTTSFLAQGTILAAASLISRVIGLIYRMPLTAIIGDTGNDYVAGKLSKNGHDAEGYFEWGLPDGTTISWDNAVFDVKNCGGGDATNVGALEVDIISNGKPTVTPAV